MTAKEKNNYKLQTLKMCIQTFFNLNGVMPGTSDMIDWLGKDYTRVVTPTFGLCLPASSVQGGCHPSGRWSLGPPASPPRPSRRTQAEEES